MMSLRKMCQPILTTSKRVIINFLIIIQDYMTEFKLIAYEKENGEIPVEECLDSVNPKMRAKIFGLLGILQEKGNMLREPYSKHLDDGIFELRCKFGSDITRVLYFFYYEGKIILTNGFVKKHRKLLKRRFRLQRIEEKIS